MTESTIPPVRDCGRYVPGHSVHWLQARLTWSQPAPRVAIEIVEIGANHLTVSADGGLQRFRNHDVGRLRALVENRGPNGALVGYHVLRLESGHDVSVMEDFEGPLDECAVHAVDR
jgi:hypothetical protein